VTLVTPSIVDFVLDWRTWLAIAVIVIVPGLLLRFVVLVYPRGDERRDELIAEMYAVPFLRRPLWVFQQVEVILWEGLPERWYEFAVGRVIYRWKLRSGEASNRQYPTTFWIPPAEERNTVAQGAFVKLMFMMRDGYGERMWVQVERHRGNRYVGSLLSSPVDIPRLDSGDRVKFRAEHIIDIDADRVEPCDCQPQDMVDCDLIEYARCDCDRHAPTPPT
jgi:hypothetical protein